MGGLDKGTRASSGRARLTVWRVGAALLLMVANHAGHTATFTAIDLTAFAEAGGFAQAAFSQVSNRGEVAGFAGASDFGGGNQPAPGFFTWRDSVLTAHNANSEFASSLVNPVLAMNGKGQVLGIGTTTVNLAPVITEQRNFLFSTSGGTTLLDPFPARPFDPAAGTAVLDGQGRVFALGEQQISSLPRLYRWGQMEGWADLGQLSFSGGRTFVLADASSAGVLVGSLSVGNGVGPASNKAVMWSDGVLSELPGLNAQFNNFARAINAAGQVVGSSDNPSFQTPTLWQDGRAINLGRLPGSYLGASGSAQDVGDQGWVVGYSQIAASDPVTDSGRRAFLWRQGQMEDLTSLTEGLQPGWVLENAFSVNGSGQILAQGRRGQEERTFFLDLTLRQRVPVQVGQRSSVPFGGGAALVSAGDASPIGEIKAATGSFLVERDGRQIPMTTSSSGFQIYAGDRILAPSNTRVDLVLADETEFSVAPGTSADVSRYFRDDSSAVDNFSLLRRLFVYTSTVVGGQRRDDFDPATGNVGDLGIRGDADPLGASEYAALFMRTGSPVKVTGVVDLPAQAFTLSFEAAFLASTGALEVLLDQTLLTRIDASQVQVGLRSQHSVQVTDAELLARGIATLAFLFDGPADSQVLIDNVNMPGIFNGDFSKGDGGWFKTGPGTAELVGIMSDQQYAQLTAVPEPSTGLLWLVGLGWGAFIIARHARRQSQGVSVGIA